MRIQALIDLGQPSKGRHAMEAFQTQNRIYLSPVIAYYITTADIIHYIPCNRDVSKSIVKLWVAARCYT